MSALAAIVAAVLLPPVWLAGATGNDANALSTGFWLFKGVLFLMSAGAFALGLWLPRETAGERAARQAATPHINPVALVALLAVGLALRIPGLGDGLWFDEIQTQLEYVRLPWGRLLTTFDSTNQHLLFSVSARAMQQLFGESATTLRMPAVLFGVASLWAALVFALRWMPTRQAWWSTAVLAVAYHHIWFSQNARGYTALLLFTIVASTVFLDLLRGTGTRRTVLLYTLAMSLVLLTHLTAATVAAAHGLAWLWRARALDAGRARWAPFVALTGAGLLTATCYAPIVPQVLSAVGSSGVSNVPLEWQNPLWFFAETVRGLARALPGGVAVVAVAGVIGALGVFVAWRRDRIATVLMLLPLVIMAIMVMSTGHNLWPRFFFFGAAFLVQLAVHGGFGLLELIGRVAPAALRPRLLQVGEAVLALGVIGCLVIAPKAWGPKQDFGAAVAFVESERAPGDVVVLTDLTRYPVNTWLGRDWPTAATGDELAAAESPTGRTWVLYTFPIRLSATFPTLWERLKRDYREVQVVPGTVGDGAIVIVRREK